VRRAGSFVLAFVLALACTGERGPDPSWTDLRLPPPSSYRGEILGVITPHSNETDVELITQSQLLDVLRNSLAKTPVKGGGADRLAGSDETG
jgi:hypothetical protein